MIHDTKKWLTATLALSASYCGGVAAADLTVTSGNTQVFDGSANFPGGVDVNGGTLVIGGNGGGSGVTLGGNVNANSNGTVAGFGSINGDLNVSGARVAPGYEVGTPTGVSNGNLVVNGNLSMNNSVFNFETGYAGLPITQPGTGDNITVRGNAAINNTTLNVTVNTLGVNAGYYRILSYGGSLSGNGLTLGSVSGDSAPAATIQNLTGDKQINLILGPSTTNLWNGNGAASATRSGGGNGTWSAASANWNSPSNATGALPDGGYAIFTGAAGTVNVDGSAGPVRVSGIQFATDRYRLQGAPITLVGSGGNPPAIVVGDGTYASGQFVDTIDNPLQGTQGFVKTGPGSVILTADSSGLTGPILIADGALEIDGKLNGPMDIGREVVLAGVGQVGTTNLYPTAVISPGNDGTPMGTLTVNGNLTFGQNTIYRVHADPASNLSDRIHVTGVAYLDGTVAHVGPDGNYAPRTTYNILTADGGIQGQFTGASSSYAFLTPTLSYDPKNAYMTLTRNDVPIGSIGGSGNESNVGGALDKEEPPATGNGSSSNGNGSTSTGNGSSSNGNGNGSTSTDNGSSSNGNGSSTAGNETPSAGSGSSLVDSGIAAGKNTGASQVAAAVLAMTPNEARSALRMLSGEAYASTASVLLSQGDTVRTLPLSHLRGNLDAPVVAGRPTAQLGAPSSDAMPQSGASPVWAQAFGNWSKFGGDGDASSLSQSSGGLFVGGDGAVGGGWRLGGAVGYIGSHNSIDDTSSRTNVDSYTATLFGGRNFQAGPGHIRFMAGAAYTWHDIDAKRDVAAGSLNQRLESSYHASSTQVFTELGYKLPLGDAYTIEPFAGLAWNQLRTRGFEESGGTAALHGSSNSDDVTSTTLGLRGGWEFGSDRTPGRLTASLGWRHAMGDVKPKQQLAFEGGSTFSVTGVPIARDAAVLGLGAEMAITRNTTAGIAYDAQFGGGNRQQSGVLKLAVRF
ncbi:autotransporter outer membrane beta-barrel domain-containing protein [Achromobacter xylosoxidans]|uniref:Autotransporter domain-containing protein n=1 Tax=Alcaligenes xylosoxydans xylosoxydans TaxID=85698 RepID=A0A424WCF8_ALCXX|nr:autotransporter outer membrane beta-barrel domain-containing protein [Achromobacter xylosoxidans]MBC9903526.1 autotransporter domain-containing protein [Achromobacter xylosoxidans]MBD0866710.1 autotransporter domain-containing protein [Achromobacter xylosoxidans]QNP84926.1 autotransporter domain-containing protein [Achromobacter xylosoxidans]RPJ90992.1 autotransporter domain-containing protein [Achromobacter xylosoxidans]